MTKEHEIHILDCLLDTVKIYDIQLLYDENGVL